LTHPETASDAVTVSVVMPTYRRSQLMARAVDSVLAQSWKDFELVIIDDNTPGHTEQLATQQVLEEQFQDDRIRYIVNEGEHGGSGARNTGIREARGECIAFLDDDEDWLPEKLEKQMRVMADADSDVGVVHTGFYDWKADGSVREAQPKMTGWIFERLLHKTGGRAPKLSTMLCRRAVFDRVGDFDTALPAREDYDLYIRIARHFQFAAVEEPLSNKRSDAIQRLTSDPENFIQGFAGVYEKIRDDLAARPKAHAIYLLKYAEVLAKAGRSAEAWARYRTAAGLWLLNPRLLTYGLKLMSRRSKGR